MNPVNIKLIATLWLFYCVCFWW